jgi:hypothetical protein
MKPTRFLGISTILMSAALAAVACAFAASTGADLHRGTASMPPASQFTARVDNQWFPLLSGTRYVYVGTKDGQPSRDVVTVTHTVRTIDGVPCVTVQDRLYLRGRLGERTTDWYSQDTQGNVWYFGERTAELDKTGRVTSTEGTWTAGVDGAEPGIYMTADPRPGRSYRQEFYKGHAEDHFKVIGLFRTVTSSGTKNAVLTQEWTPLEPATIDHKLYVRGIGTVLEQAEKGGNERAELVSITKVS